jgi:hypothetical protein
MNIAKYSKLIAAVCGALTIAVGDGILDANDGFSIVVAAATAIGVYAIPNKS